MSAKRFTILVLVVLLSVALLMLMTPAPSFGFSGGIHYISTLRACQIMHASTLDAITGTDVYGARRTAAGANIFPQLGHNYAAITTVLADAARNYDSVVGDMGTRNHFWTCDEGLHELPEGIGGVDNAWEVAEEEWANALYFWRANDRLDALISLAAVLHLVQDMAQPAHTNSDLHGPGNRDSLEEWGSEVLITPFSWTEGATWPGPFFQVPSKRDIVRRVQNCPGWAGHDEFLEDPYLPKLQTTLNLSQLFWIMYVTNQRANYFASDGESGNKSSALGWVDYAGWGYPVYLHRNGRHVSAQSESALDDNEGNCGHPGSSVDYCNYDGDLTTIANWCWKDAMRATGAVLELFRRTIDHEAPVTKVTLTRADGQVYRPGPAMWNNSPVTVLLSDADDEQTVFPLAATGVWTVYGLIDGQKWSDSLFPLTRMEKTFDTTGKRTVQVRTTDNGGNIEKKNVVVQVDVTPPQVSLASWRDWYYPCEYVRATWSASDVGSGLAFPQCTLDGEPLAKNSVVNLLALSTTVHTLSLSTEDLAGNVGSTARKIAIKAESGVQLGDPKVKREGTTRTYRVAGTLTPQHVAGSLAVRLLVQKKLRGGAWSRVPRITWATIRDDGTYGAYLRMDPGTYRVKGTHLPRPNTDWVGFRVP